MTADISWTRALLAAIRGSDVNDLFADFIVTVHPSEADKNMALLRALHEAEFEQWMLSNILGTQAQVQPNGSVEFNIPASPPKSSFVLTN